VRNDILPYTDILSTEFKSNKKWCRKFKEGEEMPTKHQIARLVMFLIYPIAHIIFRPVSKRYLTVFLFHEVTDTPSKFQLANSNYTTVKNFKRNISWIAKNYKVIDVSQIRNLPKGDVKPFAIITFDDAWKGQLDAVKHIQEKYDFAFTLFTNLGTVNSRIDIAALKSFKKIKVPSFDEFLVVPEQENSVFRDFLNWQGEILTIDEIDEINHLENSTLANHSFHHFPSSELSIDNFKLNVDLNQKKLASYRSSKKYFAFPFGRPEIDFDDQHIDILKKGNYECIFSADGKLNKLPLENRVTFSRVNFSPTDCMKSDFWWATNKNTLLRRS
jgi:peptidoglycan/xylan/chitin deacetylase (PgdA/CDA1 family)